MEIVVAIVLALTGRAVPVECGPTYVPTALAETWGLAPDTSPLRIVLGPEVCRALRTRPTAEAVAVLTHEAGHVALLSRDENAANCWARKRIAGVALRYRLGPYARRQARALLPCYHRG